MHADLVAQCRLSRALRILALGLAINALAAWRLPGRDLRCPACCNVSACVSLPAPCSRSSASARRIAIVALLLAGYAGLLPLGGTLAPWITLSAIATVRCSDLRLVDQSGPATAMTRKDCSRRCLAGYRAAGPVRRSPAARRTELRLLPVGVAAAGRRLGVVRSAAVQQEPVDAFVRAVDRGLGDARAAALHQARRPYGAGQRSGRRFGVNAIAAYAGSELMQILLPASGASSGFISTDSPAGSPRSPARGWRRWRGRALSSRCGG